MTKPIAEIMVQKLRNESETQYVATTSADFLGQEKKRGEELLKLIIDKRIEGIKLEEIYGINE